MLDIGTPAPQPRIRVSKTVKLKSSIPAEKQGMHLLTKNKAKISFVTELKKEVF